MLCAQCQSFCQEAAAHIETDDAGAVRWAWHSAVLHDSLSQLKAASDRPCPICRAVYFTPTKYEKPLLPERCAVVFELDPQDGAHPVLSTTFQDETGKTLVPKRIVAVFSGLVEDDELAATLSECAGVENDSTGSNPTLMLASFWLKRCLETHGGCAKFTLSPPFMPSRVLDVSGGQVRLVETAQESMAEADKRYVALSHCWGKIHIITTETETLQERMKGIAMHQLSKTFQEAVDTTRRLSFRYLWIDSLCIVQNDSKDWEKEAAQMCNIYQNATLTIAAAHAPGGDVGCFKKRDGVLQLPLVLQFPASQGALGAIFTSYGRAEALSAPEPPLYGRAWVLQEQILSPRMLIFDGTQLRWECLCMHGSERSPQGGMSRHIGHHKSIRTGLMSERDFFTLAEYDDGPASRYQHQEWCFAVMDYTHRGMTKASDRLVAISGIADAVKAKTQNRYLAGLWSDQLWLGLLWSIPFEAEYTPTTTHAFDLDRNDHVRHQSPVAPSWSWVSVTAPVVYPTPTIGTDFIQPICRIQSASVDGPPARQTGRLHVRGHVRTAYVNSVYPYAMREAASTRPDMVYQPKAGEFVLMTHRGLSFHPSDYFLYSAQRPTTPLDWQLMHGEWRPDEVLDPCTEITFVAIAQQTRGARRTAHLDADPLEVFTMGLVPTGRAPNEYRRVGYGVWNRCAWYGYVCGPGGINARGLTRNRDRWFWRTVEWARHASRAAVKLADGVHDHRFEADALPEVGAYHKKVKVQTRDLVIV